MLRIWENFSESDFQNYYLPMELKIFSFNARVAQLFFVPRSCYSALSWELSLGLKIYTWMASEN